MLSINIIVNGPVYMKIFSWLLHVGVTENYYICTSHKHIIKYLFIKSINVHQRVKKTIENKNDPMKNIKIKQL